MDQRHELGKWGEQIAAHYLQEAGYELLAHNWRHHRAEIDLIVRKEEVLIFVEVKTRSKEDFIPVEKTIDQAKKRLLSNAASAYMEQVGHEWEVRFDIIVVIGQNEKNYELRHHEDAFFPGWEGF